MKKKITNVKPVHKDDHDGTEHDSQTEWCVYTDSVPSYEPVIVRDEDRMVTIISIEELEDNWAGKEVWSDEEFTKIKQFIKKPNRKQLYRVQTQHGVVHVTEDHSLLTLRGREISPNDVTVGETELLHHLVDTRDDYQLASPRPNEQELFHLIGFDIQSEKYNYASNINKILNRDERYVAEHTVKGVFSESNIVSIESPVLALSVYYLLSQLGNQVPYIDYEDGCYTINIEQQPYSEEVMSVQPVDYDEDYVYDLETENHHFACGVGSIIVHNTDSVFYEAGPIVQYKHPDIDTTDEDAMTDAIVDIADHVQKRINKSYDEYAKNMLNVSGPHRLEIKQELVSKAGIWFAKKQYVNWIIYDEGDRVDELDSKGVHIVRSDYPIGFKEHLQTLIEMVLNGASKKDVDEEVLSFKKNIKDIPLDDISTPTGIKNMEDYEPPEDANVVWTKGAPGHVRAALAYNHFLDKKGIMSEPIESGDKVRWVYLNDNNEFGFEKMAYKGQDDPDEVMKWIRTHIDIDVMYEKRMESNIENIYNALNWEQPVETNSVMESLF